MAYDIVQRHCRVSQIIGNTITMVAKMAAQRGLTYIEVDHNHLFLCEDKTHGKVTRDERLAGTFVKRGKGDD